MKTLTHIKKTLFQTTLFTAILFSISSCTTEQPAENTKVIATDHNEMKFNNTTKEADAQFLVNAAEISLTEIQLGQLAQQKSKMKDIKDLGKMMEEAHQTSFNKLTALAYKKNITIPTSLTDNALVAYKKLTDVLEVDFDKEYSNMMVEGHREAITEFDKASIESKDSDIKDWATSTVLSLHTHLDYAIACQKKYDIKK